MVRNAEIGADRGRLIFTTHGQVPGDAFQFVSTRGGWINRERSRPSSGCEMFLTKDRPDVVWTYGATRFAAVQEIVKRLDIPIVFALHNFAYRYGKSSDGGLRDRAHRVLPATLLGNARAREPEVATGGRSGEGAGENPSPYPSPGGRGDRSAGPPGRRGDHVISSIRSRGRAFMSLHGSPTFLAAAAGHSLLLVEGASKASFLPSWAST